MEYSDLHWRGSITAKGRGEDGQTIVLIFIVYECVFWLYHCLFCDALSGVKQMIVKIIVRWCNIKF